MFSIRARVYPCRAINRSLGIVCMPAVFHPLPYIAVHIVETKSIRLERADRRRLLIVPLTSTAAAVGVVIADVVAPGIGRRRAGMYRVLPLGLGQQAIGLARQLGDPCDILLC